MLTIWKATFVSAEQEVEIPSGSQILTIREQNEAICMWYRCDSNVHKEIRTFRIVGTGHEAPPFDWVYRGTASLHGGELIFHVFERVIA